MRKISALLGLLLATAPFADVVAGTAGSLQFSAPTYARNENTFSVTITVTRTGGSAGNIAVDYATSNGTATVGQDYQASAGTLSWGDNDSAARTFNINLVDDLVDEPNETVNLTLTNPTNGATLGAPNPAVLTLLDDEQASVTGIGTVAATPAATLLLPHFQVDTADPTGVGTALTIGNAANASRLGHVTLWTDRGVPTRTFDVRIPASGTVEIDLRALFASGTLPAGTVTQANCLSANPPPAAPLGAADLAGLRNAHTGQASSLLGGQCGGATYGDGIARGYVTVDAVDSCGTAIPGDVGYFGPNGSGVASNDNVLWGEYSLHTPSANSAYGDTLVHIEASTADKDTDGVSTTSTDQQGNIVATQIDYTFYGRRQAGAVDDAREALPQTWYGSYSLAGVIPRTTAVVWRDPGIVAPFSCNAPPAGLSSREIIAFDQREEPYLDPAAVSLPLASQAVRLDDPGQAAIPFENGMLRYALGVTGADPLFGGRNQAFVSHLYESSFGGVGLSRSLPLIEISEGFSNSIIGISLGQCIDGIDNNGNGLVDQADPGCAGDPQGSEVRGACSDGNDNDGDGIVDFPADLGCTGITDNNETNPACIDGIDNDGDGLTDFPADPGCTSATDFDEVSPVCSDGIDNDGDGQTDFPADLGCFNANDADETNPACIDGIDNDGDGQTDFPADIGCFDPIDNDEANPACNDGIDNDGDGQTDFPSDLGCSSADDAGEENPACIDGIDNDGDGQTDFPADLGCFDAQGGTESPQCSNTQDDDGDTLIDFPNDLECVGLSDNTEFAITQCEDGIDNDGDGQTDYPADAQCGDRGDNLEGEGLCSDGVDNDLDGLIDFPDDPGCTSAADNNEIDSITACNDDIDNDGDGLIDFPFESGCASPNDRFEGPDCAITDSNTPGDPQVDPIDNDLDGLANFGNDPGCASATDQNELAGTITRGCSDGIDNDNNGLADFPNDAGCTSAYDDVEFTLGVKAPTIDVVPNALPNGRVGDAYQQPLAAIGGVGPYTFAVTSGALPPGLTLAPDGTLSGTPTQPGLFAFVVTATDSLGTTGTQAYSLRIATVAPTIPEPAVIPTSSFSTLLLLALALLLLGGFAMRRD